MSERTPEELSAAAELQALREEEDGVLESEKSARDKADLERLRLTKRFRKEIGALGCEFVVVDLSNLGETCIFLKKPAASSHKKYMAAVEKAKDKSQPIDNADTTQYVVPYVLHPSREEFIRISAERHDVPLQCAAKMMGMLQGDREANAGK